MSNNNNNNNKVNILDLINNLKLIELNSLISSVSDFYDLKSVNFYNNFNQPISNESSDSNIKKEFDVIIEEIKPDKKITLLKFIKSNFNFSLKESKEIIDSLPRSIKKCSNQEEAEDLKKKLEDSGALVSFK